MATMNRLTARIKCQLNAKGLSPKRAPLFASVAEAKQCIDRLLHP